jgi:undecaprenyl-diphosphatase
VVTLRRKSDAVGLAAGLIAFAVSGAIAARGMVVGEAGLFVAINSLTDWFYYAIWPFMQFGVFLTIPILVVIALVMRRVRLATAMAIGGVGVYLLALVAKGIVDRDRPAALLTGVETRETFVFGSLGFPSGHAAVAAALTVVVTPYLSGRWRYVPVALLAIVLVGRPYVGAHLPLDLVGGAALGVAAGSAANPIVGVPVPAESMTAGEPREEPATE